MKTGLIEFLFAPRANCLGCGSLLGADKGLFCAECFAALEPLYTQNASESRICRHCGEVMAGPRCPNCHRTKAGTLKAVSAYDYEEPVRSLVHSFKFRGAWRASRWMAEEMAKALSASDECTADVIVPVPLHKLRKLERGYNQSEKLASALSALIGIPIENALKRVKYTKQQALLSQDARRRSLQGAFAAVRPLDGARVMLVDDVRTTGTTIVRCADALFEAGAQDVIAVTFASALLTVPSFKKYSPDKGIKLEKPPKETDDF
ncbi:MAG: ComF family protein [Clostridia bacterium]|nr:ComF family protein [Clostridia bacterium]